MDEEMGTNPFLPARSERADAPACFFPIFTAFDGLSDLCLGPARRLAQAGDRSRGGPLPHPGETQTRDPPGLPPCGHPPETPDPSSQLGELRQWFIVDYFKLYYIIFKTIFKLIFIFS